MADETQLLDDERLLTAATPFSVTTSATATPNPGATSTSTARLQRQHPIGGIIGGATATLRNMMLRSGHSKGFVAPGSTAGAAATVRHMQVPPLGDGAPRFPLAPTTPMARAADDDDNIDDEFSVELQALDVVEGQVIPPTPVTSAGDDEESDGGRTTTRLSMGVATTPQASDALNEEAHPMDSIANIDEDDDQRHVLLQYSGIDQPPDATCPGTAECTHHTAASHISATQDDEDAAGCTQETNRRYVTAVDAEGGVSTTPKDVIVMVAPSLQQSLHSTTTTTATGTTDGSNNNSSMPRTPHLPPACDAHHTSGILAAVEDQALFARPAAPIGTAVPPDGPSRNTRGSLAVTQLTYGGTLLVQDLSPRGDVADLSVTPTPAVVSNVEGGVLGGAAVVLVEDAPAALGCVREALPATLDDGMPRHANIVLTFDDKDDVGLDDVERPPPAATVATPVNHTSIPAALPAITSIPAEDALEEEVELITSDGGDGSATSTAASSPRSMRAKAPQIIGPMPVDASDVKGGTTLLRDYPAGRNTLDEEDAPFLKTTSAPPPRAAAAVSAQPTAAPSLQAQPLAYQPGDLVEARWGASWYPALVVSMLGKAVEVQWVKDNSTVHVPLKHVRKPKKSPATPTTAATPATDLSVTPSLHASRNAESKKAMAASDAKSPVPREVHTSTQLVRIMEEEDEREQRELSVLVQRRQEERADNTAAAAAARRGATHGHLPQMSVTPAAGSKGNVSSAQDSRRTTSDIRDLRSSGSTAAPHDRRRRPRSDSPQSGNNSNRIVRDDDASSDAHEPHHSHSSAIDEDFGDSATPPSALVYFSPAALAELPPETRTRCKREIPRVMVVTSLRDVVSWAMNSNFQANVPFVMLLSRAKLQPRDTHHNERRVSNALPLLHSVDDDKNDASAMKEQDALMIATALGITPLDHKWITESLASLGRGGMTMPHEPHVISPSLVSGGGSGKLQSALPTVRLFPIPRTMGAFFNDVVWCPTPDASAELMVQAAGGRIVRDASDAMACCSDIEAKREATSRGASSLSTIPPSSIALYVPPGGRVGSALRDPKLAALMQLDLTALHKTLVQHFGLSVCTRPVSYATAGEFPSAVPSPATAGRVIVDGSSNMHARQATVQLQVGGGGEDRTAGAAANRFLSMEDSQQAFPPLHHPTTDPLHRRRPPLHATTSACSEGNRGSVTPLFVPSAATPVATPAPYLPSAFSHNQQAHGLLHRPLVDVAGGYSCSQPISVTGRTLRTATGGNAFKHRRWAQEQQQQQSTSQPPLPAHVHDPQQIELIAASAPHQPPRQRPQLTIINPIDDVHDEGGHSLSTAGGNVTIAVGDDFYFYSPVDGTDEAAPPPNEDYNIGIGRVSAIAENGEYVVMRLYKITSVTMHRRGGQRRGKRGRDSDFISAAEGASSRLQRLTTMTLTDEHVNVPPRLLDLETPLFVVDEHLQDHLYILERPALPPPPPPPVPSFDDHSLSGAAQPVPEVIPVRLQGVRQYVEVGTTIGMRPPMTATHDSGGMMRGIVRSFQRDSAAPAGSLFIVVDVLPAMSGGDEEGETSASGVPPSAPPSRAVITPDMIIAVFAFPPV